MSDDKMLARIRKLLAMAEADELTDEARESYNAKAAELIAQYGIDAALLAETDPTSDRPADRIIGLDAPYVIDKADLLWAVLSPLRCKGIRCTRYPDGVKAVSMHVFGMQADIHRAELLFTSLLVQTALGLAVARPSYPGENVAAYRRTWLSGFSQTIGARLWDAELAAKLRAEQAQQGQRNGSATTNTGRSVALVLLDRDHLVQRAVDEAYPKAKATKGRSLQGSGFYDGARAGRRADLGGARLGTGQRRQVTR